MTGRPMVSALVMAAMLLPAGPTGAVFASNPPVVQEGYCRLPAAMPRLPDERVREQQRLKAAGYSDSEDGERIVVTGSRVSAETAADAAVPPPPPPPPAPPPPPPPPPPAASIIAAAPASDYAPPAAVVESTPVTASPVGSGIVPPGRPTPRPQAGLLTAGEHDDLLNPELYADYVRRSNLAQRIPALPRVDTERVLTVEVRDRQGRAVPFAPVTITCADGNAIRLATQADGTVTFFPELDRLSSQVTVSLDERNDTRRAVTISDAPGNQRIGITAASQARAVRALDLMLAIDTTGSMGDEIAFLQSELRAIIGSLQQRHPAVDIRVGFVFYRDEHDDYITRTIPLGSDISAAQTTLAAQSASGGGDYPEAMDQALIRAVNQNWRADAVKALLLVADAPPHDRWFGRTWNAAENARHRRIHITPVAASGVADEAEYAMRAMAAATQSRYLFLTDDSGIGNPHAPPAIDCYLVTRLDALLRRVIDSQISGRRIEPEASEIIRSGGQYDAGRCVLPPDWNKQD